MATEPHQSDIPKWVSNIYREIDGYYVFLPGIPSTVGSFDAHTLRAIADKLDEMNKEWDAVVQQDIRPPTPPNTQ